MSDDEPADEQNQAATDSSSLQDMIDDTTDDGTDQAASTDEAGAEPDAATDGPGDVEPAAESESRTIDADLRRKLNYALLSGLSLLALIAALQFYINASAVIDQWVAREFRSLFKMGFNLAVLLVAAAGISRQVRRLKA
jgi:hypothetical protein